MKTTYKVIWEFKNFDSVPMGWSWQLQSENYKTLCDANIRYNELKAFTKGRTADVRNVIVQKIQEIRS
jgi:hypothetical protein